MPDPTNPRFDNILRTLTPTQFAGSPGPVLVRGGRGARTRGAAASQGRSLLGQGKLLVDRLLAAYQSGGLTPADVAVLQALLGWVAGRGTEEASGAAR